MGQQLLLDQAESAVHREHQAPVVPVEERGQTGLDRGLEVMAECPTMGRCVLLDEVTNEGSMGDMPDSVKLCAIRTVPN